MVTRYSQKNRFTATAEWLLPVIRHHRTAWAASFVISLLYFIRIARWLPTKPMITGDSAAYLALASYRPPLYGWFLLSWQWLHGSLDGLPAVQLTIQTCAMILFAAECGMMLRSTLVSVVVILLVMLQPSIWQAPGWMMTESLFLALIMAGMAMQFRYVRLGHWGNLVAAAFLFGLATIARNTGLLFLLLPLGAAFFDGRRTLRSSIHKSAISGLAGLLVLLGTMSWNAEYHGRFEIGSWGGISLLTKGLPLTMPSDVSGLPPPIAAVAPYAEKARELIAKQPDFAARLRAQDQSASSDLRWGIFIRDAEKSWPTWQKSDWRIRGELAGEVSKELIRRHPLEALLLWRDDWLGLVVQPTLWPATMIAPTSDRLDFITCGRDGDCTALDLDNHLSMLRRIVLLGVSLAGPILALCIILINGWQVIRRRADSAMVLFVLSALVVHATLLLTSAFETADVRYTVATHVLEVPMLIWIGVVSYRYVKLQAYAPNRALATPTSA